MRLLTRKGYDTHIADLFSETEFLSVNQLIAYTTLTTIFKIKRAGEPRYLAERLGFIGKQQTRIGIAAHRNQSDIHIDFRLARSREGMLFQGSRLWNSLDASLKVEESLKIFKKQTKAWVKQHIPLIPT